MYLLSQVTDVRPKPAEAESGSKDYAHADDVPYKPKGEGDIAQDGRARFVVYQMFSSMYIVYVLSCILQWLPLNGHEEALSQHHSVSILPVLAICKTVKLQLILS